MSAVVWLLEPHTPVTGLIVLYLLAVLPVAVFWAPSWPWSLRSRAPAVFSFFILPPTGSFNLEDTGEWDYWLATFLIVAVVVSELAGRSRREASESARLGEEQTALRRVATLVALRVSPATLVEAVIREVGLRCDADLHGDRSGTKLTGR